MPICKLTKLEIENPPFRKLKNISLIFSDRITLIAGHNGIGKSTILALIANGSGLTTKKFRSYTGKSFTGLLNEIIHIDYDSEFLLNKNNDTLSNPTLEYSINDVPFWKRCSLTKRGVQNKDKKTYRLEARVVPRNKPDILFLQPEHGIKIGVASKVPIPTIYLGMTRMIPIGESDPEMVENSIDKNIEQCDAEFITNFIYNVIGVDAPEKLEKAITTQAIKGTNKLTKHPTYGHSPKSVSLGQDSLSAIATALASFKKLEREWEDYPGGLLVIDELDAGFHPYAQQKLIEGIGNAAKKFRLQVVATTHSLCMIESVHPELNPIGGNGKSPDSIIYITDTIQPRAVLNPTLDAIRNDMLLLPPKKLAIIKKKAKVLKIYLEDAEANIFLTALLNKKLKKTISTTAGVSLKQIPISVGCNNLQGLQSFDPHFKTVLIVVDADASVKNSHGKLKNVVKLPGGQDSANRGFSPERTIYEFAKILTGNNQTYPIARAHLISANVTSNQLHEHIIKGETDITKREPAKRWMNERLHLIQEWKLVELWLEEHPEKVKKFENDLIAAAIHTAKLTP